jgi:hypothetical protein
MPIYRIQEERDLLNLPNPYYPLSLEGTRVPRFIDLLD